MLVSTRSFCERGHFDCKIDVPDVTEFFSFLLLHTKRDEHESLEFMEALLKEKDRLKEADDITRFRYSYVNQGKYAQHISNYLNYFSNYLLEN